MVATDGTVLTHITPRFPPQIDGLGDYSLLMAEHLRQSFGMESRFIVGDPGWSLSGNTSQSPIDAKAVPGRSASALLGLLGDAETVVLHYVPYGYHPRGVPFWINRAFRRWKRAKPGRRLIVVFHEVWASGPPWKSEFYLSLVQRRLVAELHRLSDGAMTSVAVMVRMLDSIQPGKTRLVPIPSAFPQMTAPDERAFHREGPVRVVAFGQEASRHLGIQMHEKLLRALHADGLLAGVDAVGKGADDSGTPSSDVRLLRSFLPAPLIRAYRDVTPAHGAELLRKADLFLSYYPSHLLCKSSALTAALASGCIPLLTEGKEAEPLVDGTNILACDGTSEQIRRITGMIRGGQLGSIGEAGWRWYDRHASWPVAAGEMASLIGNR